MANDTLRIDDANITALAQAIATQIRKDGTGLLANVPDSQSNSDAKADDADYQFAMRNLEKHLGKGFIHFVK